MKKKYIAPELMVVTLGTSHMMAESIIIDKSGTKSITTSSEILVKEQNVSDVNVWDNEW